MTKTFETQVRQLATEWGMSVPQLAEVVGLEPADVEGRFAAHPGEVDDPVNGGASIPSGLEPLATLIGLQDRLARTYADKDRQHAWLIEKNEHFDGLSPLDVMRTGRENIQWLAYYMESRLNFTQGDDS